MRIEIVGHPSDPEVAWARLGDTDYMNRVAGNGAVEVRLQAAEAGAPRVLGVRQGPMGMAMPFEEYSHGWVWQRWFRHNRRYDSGPLAESRFELRLRWEGEAVVPRLTLDLEPAGAWVWPLLTARASQMRARWQAVMDALPAPGIPAPPPTRRPLTADARAALSRWRAEGPAEVVDAVERLLQEARATELQGMRPFQIADRLELDREVTLVGMLRGVRAGAVELFWSVRCTRCQGEVAATVSLSDLADHASCASCQLEVEVDLARTVEVRFAPHPSVLPRVEQRFCTFFPAGAPTLRAAVLLAPGDRLDEEVAMESGRWVLGDGGRGDGEVRVGREGADAVVWPQPGTQRVRSGTVRLVAANEGEAAQRLILAAAEPDDAWVSAAHVATYPEFRRELGDRVLAPNLRIGSRRVALLFSDLSGSTALYERVGDARAFALVRDHFELMQRVVERNGGEVVKTIGDAVMASFPTARQAVDAGLAVQAAFDAWVAGEDVEPAPRLNVGVHVGVALAVHTNASGLDWFGRTVNLAARTQATAREGALVLTEEAMGDPGVDARIRAEGRELDAFEADLKGLGRVRLYRLAATPSEPAGLQGKETA